MFRFGAKLGPVGILQLLVVQRFPAHSRKLADFVIKPDRSPVWLEYLEARDEPLWRIGLRWEVGRRYSRGAKCRASLARHSHGCCFSRNAGL
jgi:hypothetical protein